MAADETNSILILRRTSSSSPWLFKILYTCLWWESTCWRPIPRRNLPNGWPNLAVSGQLRAQKLICNKWETFGRVTLVAGLLKTFLPRWSLSPTGDWLAPPCLYPSSLSLCVSLQVSRPQTLVLPGLFRRARCLLSKMLQLPCYIPVAA